MKTKKTLSTLTFLLVIASFNLCAQYTAVGKWKLDSIEFNSKMLDSVKGTLLIEKDSSFKEDLSFLFSDSFSSQSPITISSEGVLEYTKRNSKYYKFGYKEGILVKDYEYADFLKIKNKDHLIVYHRPAFAGDINYIYYYTRE